MRKSFSARNGGLLSVSLFLSLFFNAIFISAQCTSGTLAGTIYVDANNNGINEATENLHSGLLVRAYDASGTWVGQAASGTNGQFVITGLTDGDPYRLEYSIGSNHQVSNIGQDNNGDIQFATAPFCDANLGVASRNGTCADNTEVFLSCFVNGLGTNSPGQETLIGLVNSFNASSQVNVYATQAETGAVWGMAYSEGTQQLYSSAFVKQHASLGPGGLGAIYRTSTSGTPSTVVHANLSALGQNVGALTNNNASSCSYGLQVGKMGLGGMTIDDGGAYLYVSNLFNNTIVKVNATNPTTANTTAFQVPNPGCSANDNRIFGLKYHNGSIYVGVTCTGENSGNENDTSVHVYEMDDSGVFSIVFSDTYSYGFWSDNNIATEQTMQWLTDIDFDSNNNMILAFSDRLGHTYCNGGSSRIDDQYGDILIATPNGGNWVLESNGVAGSISGTGVGNAQGPGGGEFFGDDFFPANPSNHPEVALGSIYILPGSDEVISAVFDPAFSAYSGGLHRYSTTSGQKVGVRELYNQNISNYFGKATGFGDIVAGCGLTAPQIGNYVWIDSDCDGVQDAGETPMSNTQVSLYDDQCNLIASTLTDIGGNYNFSSGIIPGAQYYITLDPAAYDMTAGSYNFTNIFYAPTNVTVGTNTGSDITYNHSCSTQSGIPMISVVPSGNNTTFDIGLKPATEFDLALMKINKTPNNNEYGDIIDFEIQVYNQGSVGATNYEIVDYITPAYQFDQSLNPGWVYNNGMAKLMINNLLLPGQNHNETIRLKLVGSPQLDDLINQAEISYTMDTNGVQDSDIDSTSDDDSTNDVGGVVASTTDDLITDVGLIDEDDEDPAMVYIFDLALSKVNRNDVAYDAGQVVTFDITVTNQGNIDATSFEIADNFPLGLLFNAGSNQGWTQIGPQLITYNYTQGLVAGGSTTVPVNFTIDNTASQLELMNYAEISSFVSADPSITNDFDSDPDTDMFNDVGGVPNTSTDGMILDHALVDEDDHDPASVSIRAIDLALIKTVAQTSYQLGSDVTFEISIHNQGTAAIGKIELVDFLPANMTLVDNAWTLASGGTMAYKEITFLSPLLPGQIYTDYIELQINANGPSGAYLNYAEISQVWDVQNVDVSGNDIDSSPDAVMGNDPGGMPASAMDDYLDGTGLDDEDDSDPAMVYVPTIQFNEECTCLNNATESHNGQFRNEIKITSTSGEDWYIDFEYEFYDITSAVGSPVSYATGPTGKQFSEFPNGDGTSCYILRGKSVDGHPFTLRATNGWGVYLSIEGGDCSYCAPLVEGDGLGAVCANSTHTYTVDTSDPKYDDCVGFSWFLSGGAGAGTIVNVPGTNATGSGTGMTGSGTGANNSITIEWGAGAGPHDLVLIPHCPNDCVAPVSLSVQVGMDDEAMSCLHEINVSLNDGCKSTLFAEDILTSEMSASVAYQLILTDAYGDVIQGNNITSDHLWTRLMAKVMNPCSGNSCWAFINVEDKLPPKIQCDDIEVKCYQMHNYEPLVIDNCSTAEYRQTGETTTPLPCTSPYIKEIYRTYVAEDGYGNVSAPCTQKINVLPIDLDEIDIPINYTILDDNALSCDGLVLNEEGNPDVSMTGVPTIGGAAIYPITDLYCNIGVDYRDVVIIDFGCSKKLMRTWTIYDGCKDPLRRVQTIEIADTRAPWVDCPANVTINTDGSVGCDSDYAIPMPEITDDCTVDNFVIDVNHAGGFVQNMTSATTVNLNAADDNVITYNVYDQCGNLATCDYRVTVMDNISPTAVCDQNSVVSLRLNGTAKAFPQTFDDGSYDDCDLFKTLVRRMDSPCECDRPEYDDMHYLGERNGRMYYLSSFERPCFKAFAYATAYGGSLLTLESQGEHDWVYEQVNGYLPGVEYYIGLKDKTGTGEFTWNNHAAPSFNVWAGGAPSGAGDCVVVNADGEWADVGDLRARFVMEVSNPCAFSSAVSFCCADVGEQSMVVLRAIDYFGGYNDCMVNVEVQDKVAPIVSCPSNLVLDCAAAIDLNNLDEYGSATASDSCVVNIDVTVIDERNQCGLGRVIRRFTASDNSGSSQCDQIISFNNDNPFDFAAIVKPLDFDTDLGCNFGALHPDNLPAENAYPIYPTDACDLVDGTFEDQIFSFAGPGSNACLKIQRKWTVIDWCQNGPDGLPMTVSFDQTIKVQNVDGPVIDQSTCEEITVSTIECDNGEVTFTVTAHDDCTPDAQIQNCLRIDIDSDGTFDFEDCLVSNVVSFNNKLPLGHHTALISFSDLCGNTSTCSKEIWVKNEKLPIAYCKSGLSVALEPMDLVGNDGIPDDEMACIFPHMLDVNSTHPCGNSISLSFCEDDPTDMICFDCTDIGTQIVTLCVIDEFGNSAKCQTTVEVQDNNDGDFCPEFDLALIKQIDFTSNAGPFSPGDDVDFRIIILNQGNQDAYNIQVADYIPTGFTLNDADWNMTAGTAYMNNPIGFIPAGGSASVFITLQIDNSYMGDCIINYAEIIGADDDNDSSTPGRADLDSTPDTDQTNDIVGGDNFTDNANNDEDDHDLTKVDVIQVYDLALTKDISSSTPGPYMPGDDVCYDITVTNQGTLDATTIVVSDNVPAGLILNDPNWTLSGGAAVMNSPIAFLGVGSSTTVKITFTIDPAFMGSSILNDAQIIDPDGSDPVDIDSNTATDKNVDEDGDGDGDDDDEDWEMIAIGQVFDLALTKVVSSTGPFLLGDVVTFDITVFNQGSLDATNVEVSDYVPSGFIYTTSAFNSSAGWSAGPNPSNNIGTVATNSSSTVQIQLTIDPTYTGNTLVNDAEITAANNALNLPDEDSTPNDNSGTPSELGSDNDVNDAPDNPNDNDDYDPAEVVVDRYDLALTKNISSNTPGPFMQGSTVTYDIVVSNQGTLDATTVQVADNIPAGLTLNDSNWNITGGMAVLNTPIAFISAGSSTTVSITFTIDANFMGTTILNDAQIIDPDGSDLFDIDSNTATDKNVDEDGDGDGDDDDEDWEMITVGQNFDLALTKVIAAGGPTIYQPGDIVTFTISVINQGSLDAMNVEITDYVPLDLIYTQSAFNMSVGWSAGPNPTLSIGNLPFGNTATRQIQLQIDPNYTGALIINDAEITNATNSLGVPDEDSTPNDNSNTPSETGTDNDITDTPDNPNDNDDYDPAEVSVDCNLPPICSVVQGLVVSLDENGQATLSGADVDAGSSARCDGLSLTFSLSQTTFTCADKDNLQSITVVVTDSQGNVSNDPNCFTTVTVEDVIDPTITCQNITTTLNADGTPVIDLDDVIISTNDNCGIASTVLTPITITNVCISYTGEITVTDICGNTGTCNFEISIADEPPVARCKDPFDLCLDANGMASLTAADIDNGSSDDCGLGDLAINQMSFDCDDVGPKVIMLSVHDNNAVPQSDQCTTVVTIIDKTPPTPICQSITVEVGAGGTVNVASVQIDNGSNDACGLANNPFVLSQNTFECSNKGIVNTVSLTVTDANGNTASCNANVNVQDNIDPTIACRTSRFVNLDADGEFVIASNFIVTGSGDNCPGHVVVIDRTTFTCSDKDEVVVVTATATDMSGNTASCSTNITVRDLIDPTCTLLSGQVFNVVGSPPVVTVDIDDVLDTYSDNCAIAPTTSSISPNDFDCSDLGLNTITLTVDDGCGNTSTCATQITIQDVSVPTCNVIPDITLDLESNGMLTITPADINISSTAGCDPNATLEVEPNFFACNSIPLNPHCVILTVTASNGNSATCKSNVTVQDVTPPSVTCRNNFSLDLDANGNASLVPADIITSANDECDPITQTIDITTFDCDDKPGPVVVTATVTDDNGNTSTCTTNVTIDDDLDPSCTLETGLSFDLIGTPPSVTLTVADVLDDYEDNCGTAPTSSSITPATFDCTDVGPQSITVTVSDACGNSGTCTTVVNIADTSDPICIAQDVIVCLDDTGNGSVTAAQIDNGSNAGCGTNVNLSVTPTDFDCGDLGANTVVLTVTTTGGNSSTCSATVTVEDKIAPVITCPINATVECGSSMLMNLPLNFGNATATDNCPPAEVTSTVSPILDDCGLGTVTRIFTASDGPNMDTCHQVITVEQPPIPMDSVVCPLMEVTLDGCIDLGNIYAGSPILNYPSSVCIMTTVDSTFQDTSPQTMGTCVDTFLKTWTILEECSGVQTICQQTIILSDGEGPEITCTDVVAYLPVNFATCSLFVDLPVTITDPCTMNPTGINDSDYADNMDIANAAGTYPGGSTDVIVTAEDNCGNVSTCEYSVTVLDTFAAILSCSKILESIQASQTGVVTIDQAVAMLDSSCPDDNFFLSFSNTNNMVTSFIVDCADAANPGGIVPGGYWVYLWSGTTLLDSCNNMLQVLDGAGHCTSPITENIVGRVYTEDDEMLPEVMVSLEGSGMAGYMTDDSGHYAFEDVNMGDSYMILPEKDKDYLNGVSTLDLIIIQRHVLGLEPLDSPYKIIAADINKSDEVNGLDLVELRKLILGLYTELPANTSWRMVDEGHDFIDLTNPFLSTIPENYIIYDFQDPMEVDFIGVKIGDVNGSVLTSLLDTKLENRAAENVQLDVPELFHEKGSIAELVFTMNDLAKMDGFQYSIELDPSKVEILEFNPIMNNLSNANVNMTKAADGIINFSWNSSVTSDSLDYSDTQVELFELLVRHKDEAYTSDYLSLNESITPEAYMDNLIYQVELDFHEESREETFDVHQNIPNPWSMSTEIDYYLPVAENILFNIYNVHGELIVSSKKDGMQGMNTIILDKEDLATGGIYYYEIVTKENSITQKMILIK